MKNLKEITGNFLLLSNWTDRYNYLIELSEQLPLYPEHLKTAENRIECNSRLFFHVSWQKDQCVIYAESNTPIPAGLAALLYLIFNGQTQQEIRQNFPFFNSFLQHSKLLENLTTLRKNAFLAMINKIYN